MERLTHEADFGFEDWEETLFSVKSDPNGAYNILDIAKYQGKEEFDQVLINIALRLAAIENILGDDYDLERLRKIAQADKLIGKEVWAQAKYLNIFQTKSSFIQRTTIQYVSLLKGKTILCHTQTCAFPLNEIGETVFRTREAAEAALKGRQDG